MLELERAQPILGSTFIERMTGKEHAILRIGNEYFTRHQLVTQVGTGNFRAARILSDLVKELGLHTVKDLYHISPFELAGAHGVGTTTLFVLMSLFESKGMDVMKWYGVSTKNGKAMVTFEGLKGRATKRDVEGAKREKASAEKSERRRVAGRSKAFLAEQKNTKGNGRNPNARLVKTPTPQP